jgi:hypothetical protein
VLECSAPAAGVALSDLDVKMAAACLPISIGSLLDGHCTKYLSTAGIGGSLVVSAVVLVEVVLVELELDVSLVVVGSVVVTGSVELPGSSDVVGSRVFAGLSVLPVSSGGPSVTTADEVDEVPVAGSLSVPPPPVLGPSVATVPVPPALVVPVSPSSLEVCDPSIPAVPVDPPLGLRPVSDATPSRPSHQRR